MHPRISINTISTLTWPLADDLAMLRRLGAKRIGFPLMKIENDIAGGIAAIRQAGLEVTCVAALDATASLLGEGEAMTVLAPSIDATAQAGCSLCYFTSGRTPPRMSTDAACTALTSVLPEVAAYAERQGVRLAVENNSITNRNIGFVHTLPDAFRLCGEAGISLCLELQNCWYERDLPRLFRENMHHIAQVQVSDFMVGEELRLNRRALGDGTMPLAWLITELLEAGYAGVFDIEIIGPSVDAEGPEIALQRSIDWLNNLLMERGA
ncbi:hypothetical protein MB02_10545 [Croceicoccus estronivorus]|uniref:sugar phosphate isomerase/epimerase family protein n=1 Tax=Croceicoccus estronivorus TaxID=1172626 RepID=UPI000835B630|nr:sugar phosphate isomerase/epimerase family protein [Croceicoccus estronivorus]OCC23603.1 hypothetical protein MB02_10545 [Croceicoccus estronivorus]